MKLSGPNDVTMLAIMTDMDVRFTPSGQRMAVVYTNLYPHMRFEIWDDAIIEALIDIKWPPASGGNGREETLLEVTGKLEIKSYKTTDYKTARQNNFTIKEWKLG